MAKIVTVHGSFAHIETVSDPAEMAGDATRPWWQPGSSFEMQIKKLVGSDGSSGAPGSEVEFQPFVWKGDNSEIVRRQAASRLLSELKTLEDQAEKYCVLAHSHGGSVVASALLEGASRGVELNGLKRWITIGTPFVQLRRERFLFMRLPLLLKAMFVASLMLLFMYGFYILAEFLGGKVDFDNDRQVTRLIVSTVLTAIPFIVFYAIALVRDRRQLFIYRGGNKKRAKQQFGERWLPLTHEDDEAVRGLASLGSMRLKIFNRDFAVPALSMLSVFMLPLAYLWVVASPSLMLSIADYLKNDVYKIQEYRGQEGGVDDMVRQLRQYRRKIRRARQALDDVENDPGRRLELQSEIRKLRQERSALRKTMNQRYPDLTQIRRAQRFQRRFLQRQENDRFVTCNQGRLCGDGKDVLVNAKLLFHLVTDEVAGWVIDRQYVGGAWWRLLRSAVPILLVPVVFGVAAVLIVLLVQFLGGLISHVVSGWLDRQTWFEIRRTALGNDTEAEVAVGIVPAPSWLEGEARFLPNVVSNSIADHSNRQMSESISRIRAAISEFALSKGDGGQLGSALNYLTWQELIHTSYFEAPEFRKLVARAVGEADGFSPSAIFKADAEFHEAKSWLDQIAAESPK